MEICSNCNKENEIGSKFCEKCGKPLIEKNLKTNQCSKCHYINQLQSNFCEKCGNPLPQNENINHKENHIEKCSNCGKVINLTSKFCDSCGNPLSEGIIKPKTICKYCGSEIPTGAQKCMRCGEWIDKKVENSRYNGIIAIGYLFTFLGGWIGLIISLYLVTRDNDNARKNGYIMLILSIIIALIILAIFLSWLSYTSSRPYYYY